MNLIWLIAIVLFIGWLLGAFAFHVGGLVHLLLIIILILIIIRLVTGRRIG